MIVLNVENRRKIINAYIHDKGEVRLKDLEKMFPEVSSMTLRRDLIYLENKGYIIRVRGGAKSISYATGTIEDVYRYCSKEEVNFKIMEILEAEDVKIAIPSYRVYQKQMSE